MNTMSRRYTLRRCLLILFCMLLVAPVTLAQGGAKREYVIVFVPVEWSGTTEEFDAAVQEQLGLFVARSGLDRYAEVKPVSLHENLTGVGLDDPDLPELVQRFALSRAPGDRYVGLTDGDLVLNGQSGVVGWSRFGSTSVVCEAAYPIVSAHELGHTYSLCDEYNYVFWVQQDRELGGCPNPYPPECPQVVTRDMVTCQGLPAESGAPSIMGPALGPQQEYNRPCLDHLESVFEGMLGRPVGPTPTLAPGATPLPTRAPRPTPTLLPTPGPRLLLVSSDQAGPVNLYIVDTGGRPPQRLTAGWGPDVQGTWSPDGSQIVYVSAEEGPFTLYLLSPQDGQTTPLIPGMLGQHPAWSPDGGRIAFASDREGNWDIYTVQPDGSDLRNLTNSPMNEDWPAWSPAGDRLAYASDASGDWEVYLSDVHPANGQLTGVPTQLTASPGRDLMPAWSPNGRNLAFVSERDGLLQVYVMPTSADALVRATRNQYNDWGPVWVDDHTLLFQSFRNGAMVLYATAWRHRRESYLPIGLWNAAWPAISANSALAVQGGQAELMGRSP